MKALFTAIVLSATLAASGASAQGSNLSGRWQCMAQCLGPPGGFAFITQNGWDLNIVNDAGMASRAWEDYPGHIWIEGVQMGALYSPDGFTLQFTNGTIWQRAPILAAASARRFGTAVDSNRPSARSASLGPCHRVVQAAAGSYLVMMGRVVAGGVGAGGEIESVTHAFQPEGRSDPSNSP